MQKIIAGVDLGGTNIRIALANRDNPEVLLSHVNRETPVKEGPEQFLISVSEGLSECCAEVGIDRSELQGIGCTIPGITDAKAGKSLLVTNLVGWDGYPIKEKLESSFGISAAIDNDVNAAALGEYWYGQGKSTHSIVYLTISTGIAAGIVVDGVLLRGVNHAAGEMGFFVHDPRLLNESWEPNGCLELNAAGVGIAKQWYEKTERQDKKRKTAKEVFEASLAGDKVASQVVIEASNALGQAVIAIATVIDPERVILSGSIVQYQSAVFEHICRLVKQHVPHAPEVVLSNFGGRAPLIGALALIERQLGPC